MLDTVKVLILSDDLSIGSADYPEYVEIKETIDDFDSEKKEEPDMVFIGRPLSDDEMAFCKKKIRAYTLFLIEGTEYTNDLQLLGRMKCLKKVKSEQVSKYIFDEAKNYFPKPYGEKFMPENLGISPYFKGKVTWNGHSDVYLEGDFGPHLKQIAFYRNCIPFFVDQCLDLWLEYESRGDVEIELEVTQYARGSLSTIEHKWTFSQKELDSIVSVDNPASREGMLFFSIRAKGEGSLRLIALHDRYGRRGHGAFLPGGKRRVSSKRQEVFTYFDPGDLKPPLNVYFSGFKTKEGFEGYNFMRVLGCPFLLISEPRLDGGAAYFGDHEYESMVADEIKRAVKTLGFKKSDVILTGISMGATGALYYAADIEPHAVIVGKPLTNLGSIADNEKLLRPGGFPTSLDWVAFHMGDTNLQALDDLNERFWKKFEVGNFSNTKFAIAYMIEDDYDSTAYNDIISHLYSYGVEVFGKGLHGRHNDETGQIVDWFSRQHREMLRTDFKREIK